MIHIDHRRAIAQHLPWMRGSVLGKLLADARSELDRPADGEDKTPREHFAERYEQAMEALKTPHVRQIEGTIAETAKRTLGFIGAGALAEVEVRFGVADPANPLNSLRLEYVEGGSVIPAEELGLGVQSAVVVGVFEAMRQLGGPVGTVVIEEPEMYLHPRRSATSTGCSPRWPTASCKS
jgi:hypothetical protein